MLNCARSAFKTHRRHRHHLLPRGMGESRAKNSSYSGKDRGNIPIPFIYRNSCFSARKKRHRGEREKEMIVRRRRVMGLVVGWVDVAWDHHKVGYFVRLLQDVPSPAGISGSPVISVDIQVEATNDWKIICSSRPRGGDDQRRSNVSAFLRTYVRMYVCIHLLFLFCLRYSTPFLFRPRISQRA